MRPLPSRGAKQFEVPKVAGAEFPNLPPGIKTKTGLAIGTGLGTAIYEAIRHGPGGIDWTKVIFVILVSGFILLLVPKSVFEKKAER